MDCYQFHDWNSERPFLGKNCPNKEVPMTLFNSMTTAVTGLKAQASSISTVSNNLANTSTTSYKSKGTDFQDLVASFSSGGSSSTGIGVSTKTDFENDAQGTLVTSGVDTYLAISGNGYFSAHTATLDTAGALTFGTDIYYTRDGDFTIDANGYLANGSGFYLLGWPVDTTTGLATEGTMVPIQITELTNTSITTSDVDYAANLPASADIGETTSASTTSIYDSLGVPHDLSYAWEKTDTNIWQLTITAPNAVYDSVTDTSSDYTTTALFNFSTSGDLESITDTGVGNYTVIGTSISFDLTYDGAATQNILGNFADMTQFGATSLSVMSFEQNGVAAGSFDGIAIDESGNVAISYDNGETVTYYQIPIAIFPSSDNLEEISGNAYRATIAAGGVTYDTAGTSGTGKIASSALENSTVDIATEFSILIQAQQIYSANAKTITTVDSMIQTIVDL